jgi:hypothetical protein
MFKSRKSTLGNELESIKNLAQTVTATVVGWVDGGIQPTGNLIKGMLDDLIKHGNKLDAVENSATGRKWGIGPQMDPVAREGILDYSASLKQKVGELVKIIISISPDSQELGNQSLSSEKLAKWIKPQIAEGMRIAPVPVSPTMINDRMEVLWPGEFRRRVETQPSATILIALDVQGISPQNEQAPENAEAMRRLLRHSNSISGSSSRSARY